MRRLTSILLVTILLLGISPFLSSYSQPSACVNTNVIKTPELIAQFKTWLNEPDGLNSRFIDNTESSFERGQRLFYDLVLNNNQICLSDLNQEMIDSIIEVIRSYDLASDNIYSINGFTISRSQINLKFKAIRDPIILANPSKNIFAEAQQTAVPTTDINSLINAEWTDDLGVNTCQDAFNCAVLIDEGSPHTTDHIFSSCGISFTVCIYTANLTSLADPLTDDNFVYNFTLRKTIAGGRQKDMNTSLLQDSTTIIQSEIIIDFNSDVFIQQNVTITSANASSITNFSNLVMQHTQRNVGGGAERTIAFSMFQLVIPDSAPPVSNVPQIADPTLFGLFNSSDNTYAILSFDGRDKVFQDQQVRLNLTVTDLDGRNNITEAHANFNGTTFVLTFQNISGILTFSTSTPLIVENLEGIATDITDGYNLTFIFSLSSLLPNGYYDLTNANVTDNNTNSTISIVRWFSFISQPVSNGGGVSTLSLSPIGPHIMLAFILVGLLSLGQANPWFVVGGWISMAMAFGMSLTGQIYIGLGSTDNLLTFSQAFPEDFSIWLFRFFIIMQFIYPIRIFALVWERLITIVSSLRTRFS